MLKLDINKINQVRKESMEFMEMFNSLGKKKVETVATEITNNPMDRFVIVQER